MCAKVLFWPDVYKEQGHWLPTLSWAKKLAEKNFDVQYMGIEDCEEICNGLYPFQKILTNTYPLGYTNEIITTPSSRWKPEHIWMLAYLCLDKDKRKKLNLSKEKQNEIEALYNFLKSLKDSLSLIVSGYFTSLETLILYYAFQRQSDLPDIDEIQFAISTTYLRHPSEDPTMRALQNLEAFSVPEKYKLMNICLYGIAEKLNEDPKMSLEDFVSPLSTFHELIPCPKILDYAHYEHGNLVHYVEPCITDELENLDDSEINWDGEDGILNKENLIFVTAGSQVLDYPDSAKKLFQAMIGAMQAADMKDYHLILCVGTTLIQENWGDYDNITVCGWAPQRRILQKINAHKKGCAIIHGGLATIKECIYYNVPFLVIPLGKDQIDNALRLEDLGLDNRFFVENVQPKCLRYFISQITQDYQSLSILKELSEEFRVLEDAHEGANLLETLATK